MRSALCFTITLLALLVSQARADDRLDVPPADQQAKLRQSVHEQFSDLFTLPDRANQLSLSKLLYQTAQDAESPDRQFALLSEARDTAAGAGDLDAALIIAVDLSKKFRLSVATQQAMVFHLAASTPVGETQTDVYFAKLFSAIDQARFTDDFDSTRQMIATGQSVAGQTWQDALTVRKADLDVQEKAFAQLAPVMEFLKQHPTDPAANLQAGEYACFVKGDWHRGLPLLARGNDPDLQKFAAQELAASTDTQHQILVADAWQNLIRTHPEFTAPLQLHAYDGYVHALPYATVDSDREHVEAAANALVSTVAAHRDSPAIFLAIGDSMSRRSYAPSNIAVGPNATSDFQDLPQFGGLLIGFHLGYAMLNNEKVITYLQPIYSTPTGEQDGAAYGRLFSKIDTCRAPHGYAIGKLKVCIGPALNSMTPTFLRIDQDHLNALETRSAPRFGGTGGTAQVFDGKGVPVCGICGRQKDGYLGLGLLYTQPVKD